MIGIPIKFRNADDEERTKTYWFHISKPEMIRLNGEIPGGLGKVLREVTEDEDGQAMFDLFEKIVFLSHGLRTEDGDGFEKSDEITKTFKQSFAYEALFDQLTESEEAFASFVVSVLPKGWEKTLEEAEKKAEEEKALTVVGEPDEGPKPPTS